MVRNTVHVKDIESVMIKYKDGGVAKVKHPTKSKTQKKIKTVLKTTQKKPKAPKKMPKSTGVTKKRNRPQRERSD